MAPKADDPAPASEFKTERSTGAKPVLDTIVQSCTVELFHSRSVALAPRPVGRQQGAARRPADLVGVVTFSSSRASGALTLALDETVYPLLQIDATNPATKHDVLRELTNQLMGRIKNRMLQFQVALSFGLPNSMSETALRQQRPASALLRIYYFQTLRGEITVTLDGNLGDEELSYSSAVRVAKEGEFIPF
jgi:hypothetical protein